MKKLIIIFTAIAISGSVFSQKLPNNETKTTVATYDGYSDIAYFFTKDLDQSTIIFEKIADDVLKKYNLTDKKYLKKTFRITYHVKYEKTSSRNNKATTSSSEKSFIKRLSIMEMELLEAYENLD
ncbi:MAG: hypothetical protein K8F54_04185 [Altibacter sp.]|uniref:hypothetical protein n=1 Tax=Altibacter sp. TaxID=2024823 RepID=UPI001DEAF207|nr:hypothetical protein [Altibacter sp.]MBZ0326779.1 hypothetical protein [Altibacter sp.]